MNLRDPKLLKQGRRFLLSGGMAVLTDLCFYYLLILFLPHSPAKAASFIIGAFVAFVLGKYYAFEKTNSNVKKESGLFALLYFLTFILNVFTNKLVLILFPSWVFFAFLSATGMSAIVNFIGQKFFVFRT